MSNPVLEILIVLILLVANGLFAMAEIAIVSARKARLQQQANQGNLQARTALELANSPHQFLSTVQIGITLIGILAGAFGGATLAGSLADYISLIPFLSAYSEAIGVGIVVLFITYFSLVIGELVPKRIGLNNAEKIATVVATPMKRLLALTRPIVQLLSLSSGLVIRLLGIKPSSDPPVTEDEIKVMIEQGRLAGVFLEAEQDMIEGVLRLGERRVGAVLTPRTKVVWLDIDDTPEEVQAQVLASYHSRFPVGQESLDNILGIVHTKDILAQSLTNRAFNLKEILREPLFVPESMPALKALSLFKTKSVHIALVTDEYGSIQGLVTHNDILDDIVGHTPTADLKDEPQALQRDDGSWLLDGLLQIDDLKQIINVDHLPDENSYYTVGGFVIHQLGSIPATGQWFEWQGYRLEVMDMDRYRVDKVLLTPIQPEAGNG